MIDEKIYNEKKKDMFVEFVKLGMDIDTACIAAEIDDKLKEEILNDENFTRRVNVTLAKKEAELLRTLNDVAEENAQRGETKQVERILELLNPERYSKVTKLSHQVTGGGATGKVTVTFADDKE